jgi:hypothetical protein
MTEIITKLVVDLSKPEGDPERVQSIPLTEEEIAEREAMAAQAELDRQAREAEETAKAEAKASGLAKLLALGLTEAEATALVN